MSETAQERFGQIYIHPEIFTLIKNLLPFPDGCQLFSNGAAGIEHAIRWYTHDQKKRFTVITEEEKLKERLDDSVSNLDVSVVPDFAAFSLSEQFHGAFSVYPCFVDVYEENVIDKTHFELIADKMMHFRCSRGQRQRAYRHVLGMEQMLQSLIVSGYFITVLPRRYRGRTRKYMRWFDERAAKVAQIRLPHGAVTYLAPNERDDTERGSIFQNREHIGEWDLLIYTKPFLGNGKQNPEAEKWHPKACSFEKKLEHAEFIYSPFQFPLETLSFRDMRNCWLSFQHHDWWEMHVQLTMSSFLENANSEYFGTYRMAPKGIPVHRKMVFFEPNDKNSAKETILQTRQEIENTPLAIHIKIGNSTRVTAYRPETKALLHDIKHEYGVTSSHKFTWDEDVGRLAYSDVRERVLQAIRDHGGIPCITATDHQRLRRQERWLDLQLTPIERMVPTEIVYGEDGKVEETGWETAYDDIGVRAVHKDIWDVWVDRAEQMNMRQILGDFQFDDVIYCTLKQSVLNGNVMGLGKTREAAMVPQLRCATNCLIVCPTKLIDTWREEIENVIQPYIRRQKFNWQGRPMDASVKTIRWIDDLENLAYYNLISYDILKKVPNDGYFYKCPKCGTVVFSANRQQQRCPGDPSVPEDLRCNMRPRVWRRRCREEGVRKHKVDVSTGNRVHWNVDVPGTPQYNPSVCAMIVDQREEKIGKCPEIPWMTLQENVFKKVKKIQVGKRADGSPIIRTTERKPHVKWTFSELLRHRFNHVIVDEALYVANAESQRALALQHLCAASRMPMTGTPMKSFPDSVLAILNWTFRRPVFPDYRPYDPSGKARWNRKYQTVVYIGGEAMPDGSVVGGKPKVLPKINNAERFQQELAPLMRRNTRNQPNVTKEIPQKNLIESREVVEMDPQHAAYYERWIECFRDWWAMMKAEEEGRLVRPGELLTKIGYLINASTIPHFMLENILEGADEQWKSWAKLIGRYKGPATAKMKKCRQLIEEAIVAEDKTIVFSHRHMNSDLGDDWARRKGYGTMVVDGRLPNDPKPGQSSSPRQLKINEFRRYDYHVMWAGLGALNDGVNLPEANRGIFMDCSWVPADMRQAVGRMLRPAQEKTVMSTLLMHKGTIDEYVFAWCILKDRSAQEGIDHEAFDDFSVDMIPDIKQYAEAIVTGEAEEMKRNMWLAIDRIKHRSRKLQDGGKNDE